MRGSRALRGFATQLGGAACGVEAAPQVALGSQQSFQWQAPAVRQAGGGERGQMARSACEHNAESDPVAWRSGCMLLRHRTDEVTSHSRIEAFQPDAHDVLPASWPTWLVFRNSQLGWPRTFAVQAAAPWWQSLRM